MLPPIAAFFRGLLNLSGLVLLTAKLGRNILTAGAENSIGKRVTLFPTCWSGLSFSVCKVLCKGCKENGHVSV